MRIINQQSGEELLSNVEVAKSAWQRFRGLMFRKSFPKGYALWITPCSSIHTMWMRVPIDVYFIGKDGTIVDARKSVRPWSIAISREKANSVLEIPSADICLKTGMQIELLE